MPIMGGFDSFKLILELYERFNYNNEIYNHIEYIKPKDENIKKYISF